MAQRFMTFVRDWMLWRASIFQLFRHYFQFQRGGKTAVIQAVNHTADRPARSINLRLPSTHSPAHAAKEATQPAYTPARC